MMMRNAMRRDLTALLFFCAFGMLCGCSWFGERPQFVALSLDADGGVHALFAFNLKEGRRVRVAYVDSLGRALSCGEGSLPEEVFGRYLKKVADRKRSGEASIVVSADGAVRLDGQELDDLRCVVSNAPPQAADMGKMHPSFKTVFGDPCERR